MAGAACCWAVCPVRLRVMCASWAEASWARTPPRIALGMGARVTLVDLNLNRLRELDDIFGGRVHTLASNPYNVERAVCDADLVIGGVLIPGAAAPKIVTRAMVAKMKKGAVVVDVAIDQGRMHRDRAADDPHRTRALWSMAWCTTA